MDVSPATQVSLMMYFPAPLSATVTVLEVNPLVIWLSPAPQTMVSEELFASGIIAPANLFQNAQIQASLDVLTSLGVRSITEHALRLTALEEQLKYFSS